MKDGEKLLTFNEAREYLGVARNTLYRFMGEGRLQGYKVGCTWRFYLGDLRSFVKGEQVAERVKVAEDRIEHG